MFSPQKIDRLIFFDYDGPITTGNPNAVPSMRYALKRTLQSARDYNRVDYPPFRESTFQDALSLSTGTTEDTFLISYFLLAQGLLPKNPREFSNDFEISRRQYLQKKNKELGIPSSDEGYINPDFLTMIKSLKQQDRELKLRTLYGIVTGNPLLTMDVRLPEYIREMMDIVVGGSFGVHRQHLVSNAIIEIGNQLEFENIHEAMIFYTDDSSKALLDVGNPELARQDPTGMTSNEFAHLRLIHANRNHIIVPAILELQRRGLACIAPRLDGPSLLSFFDPHNHTIEGQPWHQEGIPHYRNGKEKR